MLETLDAALTERVLVYGSLPPAGRDLDLLARPAARGELERILTSEGFLRRGGRWVRFEGAETDVVDLTPAETWSLPPGELDGLFAEAVPLDGRLRLAEPAAYHRLLILARRAGRHGGGLDARRRTRVDALLAAGPAVLEEARRRAPAWGVEQALEALVVHRPGRRPAAARARSLAGGLRRLARGPVVVALSGVDGAGKSSQAVVLRQTLHRLGVDADVEWAPILQDRVVTTASAAARSALGLGLRFAARPGLAGRTARGDSLLASPGAVRERGSGELALLRLWVTVVVLANALGQRSRALRGAHAGRAVIFDRYALDSVVRLEYLYGRHGLAVPDFLVRRLPPRPVCAFLLDVAPESALARKHDRWSAAELRQQTALYRTQARRLGVRIVDGERPAGEVAEELARAVWEALGRSQPRARRGSTLR